MTGEPEVPRWLAEARVDYETSRYPGDLAQDVLAGRILPRRRRVWRWTALAAGLASAAVLLVLQSLPPPEQEPQPQLVSRPSIWDVSAPPLPQASIGLAGDRPSLPRAGPLLPRAPFSLPSRKESS